MAYTEFYCNFSTGSNLNAGSGTGAPLATYTSGNWVNGTRVFTVASGNPVTDGVAVGDFVSVYADGASAPTGFVGRVTARDATTITVSATVSFGTNPSNGTGNRTLVVGGAWKGPDGASGFPFNSVTAAVTDASGNPVRVNFKNNASYAITAAITHATLGVTFQGYTTSPGDGGKATIDGGSAGASYVLLTSATNPSHWVDFIFQNNGATGSAAGVTAAVGSVFERCVFHDFRGAGLTMSSGAVCVECEAYACNASNSANLGGFVVTSSSAGYFKRCISHNNSGSNSRGFVLQGNNGGGHPSVEGCIADTNGSHGFDCNAAGVYAFSQCVAYSNGGDGIRSSGSSSYLWIENCHFESNGTTGTGYGVNNSTPSTVSPQRLVNCSFYDNETGEVNNVNASWRTDNITFSSSPLADPANGNFTMSAAGGLGTGRGAFTQTSGYAGTSLSRPDIGAVQAAGGQASAAFVQAVTIGRRYYPKQIVRRPSALVIPLPAVINNFYIPVPTPGRTRVVTQPSRPPVTRLLTVPVVTVEQTAVPVAPQQRQVVRMVQVIRREPTVINLPPPQTVIVTHPRVVR